MRRVKWRTHKPAWAQNQEAQNRAELVAGHPLEDEQDAGVMQQAHSQAVPHVARASEDLQRLTSAPPGTL